MPELGWQRGSALNLAQDSIYLVIGQQANAALFNQSSQRVMDLSRIQAGGLGQGGGVRRAVAGQVEDDLTLGIGEIKYVEGAEIGVSFHCPYRYERNRLHSKKHSIERRWIRHIIASMTLVCKRKHTRDFEPPLCVRFCLPTCT